MRANNLHLKKVNNETFYKNKLNTLIQGGEKKIRKTKWNVRTQINCVAKFKETSRVFLRSPWESRTEVRPDVILANSPTPYHREETSCQPNNG